MGLRKLTHQSDLFGGFCLNCSNIWEKTVLSQAFNNCFLSKGCDFHLPSFSSFVFWDFVTVQISALFSLPLLHSVPLVFLQNGGVVWKVFYIPSDSFRLERGHPVGCRNCLFNVWGFFKKPNMAWNVRDIPKRSSEGRETREFLYHHLGF